jgi:hypothetical protein
MRTRLPCVAPPLVRGPVGSRLAKVPPVEEEAADDVATVVSRDVPDVNDVVEPPVPGGAHDVRDEDATHLLPLLAVRGQHSCPVPAAERPEGEGERPGSEVGVLLPEHLLRHLRAGDGDDVDTAQLDARDVRSQLPHEEVDPPERRLLRGEQHLRQVADDGPRHQPQWKWGGAFALPPPCPNKDDLDEVRKHHH